MRNYLSLLSLAFILAVVATPARADLLITFNSPTITQGGTGTLDVYLSSNASLSSPDLLNNFAYTIQISGTNNLQFSSAQSFSYLTNSQYIFAGDSENQSTSTPGGVVTKTVYANDTFVGFDSTASGHSISLSSSSTHVLLAALTVDATITNPGDTYTVSLIPASGDGSMNSNSQTYFDVLDLGTGNETSAVPFSSTSGTVTISAAAVPEPSSIVQGLTALLIMAGVGGVRRRRPQRGGLPR